MMKTLLHVLSLHLLHVPYERVGQGVPDVHLTYGATDVLLRS
jgi:hypothetical protein